MVKWGMTALEDTDLILLKRRRDWLVVTRKIVLLLHTNAVSLGQKLSCALGDSSTLLKTWIYSNFVFVCIDIFCALGDSRSLSKSSICSNVHFHGNSNSHMLSATLVHSIRVESTQIFIRWVIKLSLSFAWISSKLNFFKFYLNRGKSRSRLASSSHVLSSTLVRPQRRWTLENSRLATFALSTQQVYKS